VTDQRCGPWPQDRGIKSLRIIKQGCRALAQHRLRLVPRDERLRTTRRSRGGAARGGGTPCATSRAWWWSACWRRTFLQKGTEHSQQPRPRNHAIRSSPPSAHPRPTCTHCATWHVACGIWHVAMNRAPPERTETQSRARRFGRRRASRLGKRAAVRRGKLMQKAGHATFHLLVWDKTFPTPREFVLAQMPKVTFKGKEYLRESTIFSEQQPRKLSKVRSSSLSAPPEHRHRAMQPSLSSWYAITAVPTRMRGSPPQNVHLNVWHCRLGAWDTFGTCSQCCVEADSEERRHVSLVVGTHPRAFQAVGILKTVLEMYFRDLSACS
jgi:hypothetical protein